MRVDEQRQVLSRLQDVLERINNAIAALELEKAREQVAAQNNPETQITYGAFLKSAIERGEQLERQRHEATLAVEKARDGLMILFEEQKRYEIASEKRQEAADKEDKRRETIQFDEVGSVRFTRQSE